MVQILGDVQPALRELTAALRERTLEQTRALVADGFDQERAMRIAVASTEQWARRQGMAAATDSLRGNQHVVPYGERWAVWTDGLEGTGGVYETRYEATERARMLARQQEAFVVIHTFDGQIQDVVLP